MLPDGRSRAFACALFFLSMAQAALAAPETPVTVIEVEGQPIHFIMTDGREAALFMKRSPVFTVSVANDITENTCFPSARLARCKLSGRAINMTFRWAWTRHPDAAKVGQTMRYASGGFPIEMQALWTPSYRYLDPAFFAELGPYELGCDDFGWAGASSAAPERLRLSAWNTELMLPNPETGLSENMTASGAYGLNFQRAGAQSLHLESVDSWFVVSRFFTNYTLVGQAVAWTLNPSDRPVCQVLATSNVNLDAAQSIPPDPTTEIVYIKGSDLYWDYFQNKFPVGQLPEDAFE